MTRAEDLARELLSTGGTMHETPIRRPHDAPPHDISIGRGHRPAHLRAHLRVVSIGALLVFTACGGLVEESSSPSPAEQHPAEQVATHASVLLFGGVAATDGGSAMLGDTWSWTARDGWTELHPADSPPARSGAMAARLGADLLLFGGVTSEKNANGAGETWAWDGTNWARRQPSGSPPPLTASVLAPAGGGLLLFGGYNEGIIYRDVWRWDGVAWSHPSPVVTPSPRQAPAGGVIGGSLVIFGGEDDTFEPIGDTWIFDGTAWTQAHPAHAPSPRRGASAVAFKNELVLFGGDVVSSSGLWQSLNDTWVWDGSDWTEVTPSISPDRRSFAGMAAAGDVVVLFGGTSFGGTNLQPPGTWTWDGANWTKRPGPDPAPRTDPALASW